MADTPATSVPLVVVPQVRPVTLPETTFRVSVQVWPPMLILKLAVPLPTGVPVMVNTRLPFPLANNPEVIDAVRPVTPVEDILCEL